MDRVAIIGAGVAGLSAARTLRQIAPELRVEVFERSDRVGGMVETERTTDGFLIERGPDSMVTHDPAGIGMADEVGLTNQFLTGTSAPRRAFIASGARLVPLPPALLAMSLRTAIGLLGSPQLSARGKARFLLEPFVRKRKDCTDESVAGFFARRFGSELSHRLIDPMLRGIYATPTEELSMHAAMPRLAALEQRHGSVAMGVAYARFTRRTHLPGAVSFRGGMSRLTEAMAAPLGDAAHLSTEVRSVSRTPRQAFRLETGEGQSHEVDAIIVTTPAWAAAALLAPLDGELASLLREIDYAPHLSMSMAWPSEQVSHPMDGTGFLVSRDQRRSITACTWSSRKWPGCAPDGWTLLRVFADPAADDEEATMQARRDLRDLMGITEPPALVRIRRDSQLLPLRRVGHLDLISRIENRAARIGRIAVAGNGVGMIGIPTCIAGGAAAAMRLVTSRNGA